MSLIVKNEFYYELWYYLFELVDFYPKLLGWNKGFWVEYYFSYLVEHSSRYLEMFVVR